MADRPVIPQQELASGNTSKNQLDFAVKRALAKLNVATLVQVVAVHGGGASAVGTVDVLPLLGQVDGSGAVWPATTIFGVPYLRVQGGANALIIDPVVNDIGFALFADRDISSIKSTGAAGAPASARRFNFADALYFGGWNLGTAPTNYVQVTPAAISIVLGGVSAVLTSSAFTVNTNLVVNGNSTVTGNSQVDENLVVVGGTDLEGAVTGGGSGQITVGAPIVSTAQITSNGHTLDNHTHQVSGIQTGGSVVTSNGPTG